MSETLELENSLEGDLEQGIKDAIADIGNVKKIKNKRDAVSPRLHNLRGQIKESKL